MNQFEIISILDILGIKHEKHPNSKGWLDIICPFHPDKNFGNAGINIHTGVINCYRCGNTGHIDKLWKERFNTEPNHQFTQSYEQPVEKESKVSKYITDNTYHFTHTTLNPYNFDYLKKREYSEEFIDYFEIRHVLSGIYSDYMCIPIINKSANIFGAEFRKLREYEILKLYFNLDSSFKRLKNQFKKYIKENNIYLDRQYNLHFNNEIIQDDNLKYLLQKKVLYPSGFNVNTSIFQIDNLDYDEVLWLTEGTGSMPKIWQYISKNCSCSFGSNVSEGQIEYLKRFKQINVVVDQDLSGFKMISKLHNNLTNLFIVDIEYEDTHTEYVNAIKNCKLKSSKQYISENLFKKY